METNLERKKICFSKEYSNSIQLVWIKKNTSGGFRSWISGVILPHTFSDSRILEKMDIKKINNSTYNKSWFNINCVVDAVTNTVF